jgi:hypothetical protein
MVVVEAAPLLQAEAKKNQQLAAHLTGKGNGRGLNASVKNDKSITKPINARTGVAKHPC